jgi:hypothetical protein
MMMKIKTTGVKNYREKSRKTGMSRIMKKEE